MRVVLDTNVLVSYLLFPNRAHAATVRRLIEDHTSLYSEELIAEFLRVLGKPKLARYYDPGDVAEFVLWYRRFSEPVVLTETITQCRDPKDDYLLSLAVSGRADWLVTGDDDLLTLNPFRRIAILRVAETAP